MKPNPFSNICMYCQQQFIGTRRIQKYCKKCYRKYATQKLSFHTRGYNQALKDHNIIK